MSVSRCIMWVALRVVYHISIVDTEGIWWTHFWYSTASHIAYLITDSPPPPPPPHPPLTPSLHLICKCRGGSRRFSLSTWWKIYHDKQTTPPASLKMLTEIEPSPLHWNPPPPFSLTLQWYSEFKMLHIKPWCSALGTTRLKNIPNDQCIVIITMQYVSAVGTWRHVCLSLVSGSAGVQTEVNFPDVCMGHLRILDTAWTV